MDKTYEDGIRDGVEFALSHWELIGGRRPYIVTPVDPETWWSKMQIEPHDPEKLLPRSKEHFLMRLARWKELAVDALSKQQVNGNNT